MTDKLDDKGQSKADVKAEDKAVAAADEVKNDAAKAKAAAAAATEEAHEAAAAAIPTAPEPGEHAEPAQDRTFDPKAKVPSGDDVTLTRQARADGAPKTGITG